MTREEALNKTIGILTYHQVNFCKSKEAVANMNEIIDALEKIDQERCEDAVSRQAVLEILNDAYFLKLDDGAALQESVKQLPSVTPQPKMGCWEWNQYDANPKIGNWHCSECRTIVPCIPEVDNTPIYKWCPMCGCKMQEVEV